MEKLYKEGKTLKEIGEKYNITRQRVYQILHHITTSSKNKFKKYKLFKEINLIIKERKRIIYPLLDLVNKEEIQKVLQGLVNYNQLLRPIENYFKNIYYKNKNRIINKDVVCYRYKNKINIGTNLRERYRELIRGRDNQKCQLCGLKWIKGRRLDIHHIYDENGENTRKCDKEFNKQITLCHQCHSQIDRWKMVKKDKISY